VKDKLTRLTWALAILASMALSLSAGMRWWWRCARLSAPSRPATGPPPRHRQRLTWSSGPATAGA